MSAQPPVDITQAVRAELAVPGRYHLAPAVTHPSLLEQILTWLWDRWTDLLTQIARHVHIGKTGTALIGDAIVTFCVVAIGLIGAHLLAQLDLDRVRRERATALAPARSAHALAALAAQAAAAGEYARAIRLLFIAVVTLLDLRGVVRDEQSLTVGELRRALHERDGRLEPAFVEIARLYTAAAYAQVGADEAAWRRARAAYDALAASAAS
ncbi:MAG TPA: DUF4129 domain-containing protein [Candidatus Baltobacteraceae bacterium]|nr:DUF4129 domain-containing protein [Candidatus Baltobacteraceae bacterium]